MGESLRVAAIAPGISLPPCVTGVDVMGIEAAHGVGTSKL